MTAQAGSASSPSPNPDRNAIRRIMRQRRRMLMHAERTLAALKVARHLGRLPIVKPGARIAVYLAANGEVDLAPFIALARQRHCRLYLPRIVNRRLARMEFFAFHAHAPLRRNAFGILEPSLTGDAPLPPRRLDLVLAPLLAFDVRGWRLGMGAGYYDRRLSCLRYGTGWRRPRLIGIGYDFQRVPRLDPHPWDVRMDAVVTACGMHSTSSAIIHSSP